MSSLRTKLRFPFDKDAFEEFNAIALLVLAVLTLTGESGVYTLRTKKNTFS